MVMHAPFEYEDATRLYRKKVTESDRLFRLAPPLPAQRCRTATTRPGISAMMAVA